MANDTSELKNELEAEPLQIKVPAPQSSVVYTKLYIKLANQNVRSLLSSNTKTFKLLSTFLNYNIDLMVLTETWLSKEPRTIPHQFQYCRSPLSAHQGVLTICLRDQAELTPCYQS